MVIILYFTNYIHSIFQYHKQIKINWKSFILFNNNIPKILILFCYFSNLSLKINDLWKNAKLTVIFICCISLFNGFFKNQKFLFFSIFLILNSFHINFILFLKDLLNSILILIFIIYYQSLSIYQSNG